MDYFIEFEDGSDGYLSHHGVLGMKWGVRNAETLRRYANEGGKKPSKRQVKSAIRQAKREHRKKTGVWQRTGSNMDEVAREHAATVVNDKELQDARKKAAKTAKASEKANERSLMAEDYYDRLMKEDSGATDLQKRNAKQAYIQAEAKRMAADEKHLKASEKVSAHETRIARQYVAKYQDAAVRDLGFKNVEAGKALLNEYGLMRKATGGRMGDGLRYSSETEEYRARYNSAIRAGLAK